MDLQALFNPRLPRWRVALVVVPAVVGWLLLSSSYVVRTVGVALLLMALYAGLRELLFSINRLEQSSWVVRGRSLRRLREALPVLLITGAVGVLLWPLVSGEMPQTHDHTFHFTRAWHFFEHRLSQGHFTGWSDIWFAGWPAGEDYSPGADFLVTAIYIFTLGLLGWEATYAVSIVVVFLLICLAVYRFGRVYFGVTAGLVGALFVLADPDAVSHLPVSIRHEEDSVELEILQDDGTRRQIWIDPATGYAARQLLIEADGTVQADIRYLEHAFDEGAAIPVTTEVILPKMETTISMQMSRHRINAMLPDGAFDFVLPEGAHILQSDTDPIISSNP